ncbi:MAG: transcription-repair coupling factor, partial [Clostridiales bacterium]|nr:transcription-repair coupling factor [Clostridiales bacterium]
RAHGIGRYLGIKKITVKGDTKDYLQIATRGTDSLYEPVDQLDMLYKYSGNTDKELRLNKLGGTEWNKAKQRVRASTRDMAKQLAALYAERQQTKGFCYSADTPWQRDFEDTFPYQETEDQLRSIEEVKRDMESPKPMDRLLCGDVGYGKTEVALRAAFKAVMDSKQVAYLCPTTILAMQHHETFVNRMRNFPVKVEMLSRFRTASEQAKIIKKLKTGEIDIIIGTHRLLSKDVVFKDLGLLIIDEEQRFGVAHKERLKELKKNVDVLSMSATPIPRTLHMAMVSVRDMSLLETPPENRYPVSTYVLEHDPGVLIDAMKKELSRGGQVFYLYNRVSGIYRVAEWIKSVIPDANVAVGHGKMKEEELEDIMYDMVNGRTDILVCTTIIETGLDIPNANTIIIENADRMGLAQLYQLRGRVGRSSRSAYAYLTYKRDGVLSETAEKRLSAIREFTEFGSGFKIAMRDLEIRGAGDILGAEQHGHIDSVGYDMYCKILADSVREIQGQIPEEELDTTVDLNVDAFIPEKYIRSNSVRIDTYKRIAAVENEDDASEITDELIDRFGDLPVSAHNLLEIAQIKALAHNIGITDVSQKNGEVLFTFEEKLFLPEYVQFIIENYSKDIVISAGTKPVIKYRNADNKKLLSNIKFLLQQLNELHTENK